MTVLTSSAFSTLNLRIDVVERDGIGSVQAEHDEVRFLADFERSDLRLHVQRARASDRGHLSACSALNATGSLRVTFCSLAAKSSSSTIPRSLLLPVAWNRIPGPDWQSEISSNGPASNSPRAVPRMSAPPYLTLGSAAAELVRKRLAIRREFERDGIDAVSLAGWRRAIGKDVSLVCAATGANDLSANHAVAGVANGTQMVF